MKHLIFIGLLIITLFNSCEKDVKPTQIAIKYSLNDDVSPVNVVFKVNQKLRYAKWDVNGSTKEIFNQDTIEYQLEQEGPAVVKLTAKGEAKGEYFGDLAIVIPEVANKLIIYGCFFQDNIDLGIAEDTIIFRFNYYDGNEYHYQSITVPKIEFEDNDSILFKDPIIIDIFGFENDEDYSRGVNFDIEGIHNVHSYFRSRIGIKSWYYHDRLFDPENIYIDNQYEMSERVFIKSDWTR